MYILGHHQTPWVHEMRRRRVTYITILGERKLSYAGAVELGAQGVHLRTQCLSHEQRKCRFCAPNFRLLPSPLPISEDDCLSVSVFSPVLFDKLL